MLPNNFTATIADSIRQHWEQPCYTDLGGDTLTYADVAHRILQLHHLFHTLDIQPGDRVGIIGRNTAHWCVTYLAATSYGAVAVPILPDFTPAEIENLVQHSACRLLFLADKTYDQLDLAQTPSVAAVFRLRDFTVAWSPDGKLSALTAISVTPPTPANFRLPDISNADLAAIVYTSGTTGFSKGVMLNGNALIANVLFFNSCIDMKPGDQMVSFLPLAHVFGCAFDFLAPTVAGCHVIYIEQIPTPNVLVAAFQKYKPIVVMSVPLIIEKIYRNRIRPVLEKPSVKFMLKVPVLNWLVYRKIHQQIYEVFGGQFREMVIGGAAINKDVAAFFRRIGLRMTSGYGMTECGPLISYSVYDDKPPVGSVGRIVPTMECRIAEADPVTGIGGVEVNGENRMLGYYHNQEATDGAILPDGWLRTGDLGKIDDDGFLFLTGRSKNMILTASGQNVYPEEIESQLNNLPCIEESLVVEENGVLTALVFPNLQSVDKQCQQGKQVEVQMEENRNFLNLKLPRYCRIARLKVLYQEFEKTPTKKIKRHLYNAFS